MRSGAAPGRGCGGGSWRGAKRAGRRAWAERSLERFGIQVIIVCRFIPGGRTAITLCCGLIGYPRRKFIAATAIAAVLWALYAFFIGRLGGKAFEDQPLLGLATAFGGTVVISLLIEAGRRAWAWRKRRADRDVRPDKAWNSALLARLRPVLQ